MALEEVADKAQEDRPCDLCNLPVGVAPFTLQTVEGKKYFCCDGCQGIYGLLHAELILEDGGHGGKD